jgi:hypothetical protein
MLSVAETVHNVKWYDDRWTVNWKDTEGSVCGLLQGTNYPGAKCKIGPSLYYVLFGVPGTQVNTDICLLISSHVDNTSNNEQLIPGSEPLFSGFIVSELILHPIGQRAWTWRIGPLIAKATDLSVLLGLQLSEALRQLTCVFTRY